MNKGLQRTRRMWNDLGEIDPMWAILTDPSKFGLRWSEDDFFALGEKEIDGLMTKLDQYAPSRLHNRALDFGCGIGRLSRALCKYFDRVDGVDVAPSMIALADDRNAFSERCSFHLNEAPDLSLFADESFDLIYSNIVLQHMSPELGTQYLKEFERCTKPGGLTVFQVPHVRLLNVPSLKRFAMHAIYRIIPKRLIVMYRRRKHSDLPRSVVEKLPKIPMDMHSIKRRRVESALRNSTLIKLEDSTGPKVAFKSYTYFFQKRARI